MAYDKSVKDQVRIKYVQGMPLATAAELLEVPYNTARNWKRQSAQAGVDWDMLRNAQRMTKGGLEEMANAVLDSLAEEFLSTLAAVKADAKMSAEKRSDIMVRLMDGYSKSISAASRAMPGANRLAVAMDVLKFLSGVVADRYPKFRAQFLEITESLGEDFVREFGNGA